MYVIVKFFGSCRRISVPMRADNGEEVVFFFQLAESILLEADHLGIYLELPGTGCKLGGDLLRVTGLCSVGNGNLPNCRSTLRQWRILGNLVFDDLSCKVTAHP